MGFNPVSAIKKGFKTANPINLTEEAIGLATKTHPFAIQSELLGGALEGRSDGTVPAITSTQIQPFNFEEIADLSRQLQATTGKPLSPAIVEGIASGVIKGQVEPAITRNIQERRLAFQMSEAERKARLEEEAAEAAAFGDIGAIAGTTIGFLTGGPSGAMIGSGLGRTAGSLFGGMF